MSCHQEKHILRLCPYVGMRFLNRLHCWLCRAPSPPPPPTPLSPSIWHPQNTPASSETLTIITSAFSGRAAPRSYPYLPPLTSEESADGMFQRDVINSSSQTFHHPPTSFCYTQVQRHKPSKLLWRASPPRQFWRSSAACWLPLHHLFQGQSSKRERGEDVWASLKLELCNV